MSSYSRTPISPSRSKALTSAMEGGGRPEARLSQLFYEMRLIERVRTNTDTSLTRLRIELCQIDTVLDLLVHALRTSRTLTELDLCGTDLNEASGRALAVALRANCSLKKLSICCNALGDGGGREVAEALHSNSTLAWLKFNFNHLGRLSGAAMARALLVNTTLTTLLFKANPEAVGFVCSALKKIKL